MTKSSMWWLIVAALTQSVQAQSSCPFQWDEGWTLPGTSSELHCVDMFTIGGSTRLYVGGTHQVAGGVLAPHVSAWDGERWLAVGDPPTSVTPIEMELFDDGTGTALYITGGAGANAGAVERWDGISWGQVGLLFSDECHCLGVFDAGQGPQLYVGGRFESVGGTDVNRLARWTGSQWESVGSPIEIGTVWELLSFDDSSGEAFYIGGSFIAPSIPIPSQILKWDGRTWTAVGSGLDGTVFALEPFDNGTGVQLHAGGEFLHSGSTQLGRVARWNGLAWEPLSIGMNAAVAALCVGQGPQGPRLYAGGFFTTADGQQASYTAQWDGSRWLPIGGGEATGDFPYIRDLEYFNGGYGIEPGLYAGGKVVYLDDSYVHNIARLDGESWTWLGDFHWVDNRVRAIVMHDDGVVDSTLYIGGDFGNVDSVPAASVARWVDGQWNAVGYGLNDDVYALASCDHDGRGGEAPMLYAGGRFNSSDDVLVSRIGKWDGIEWSALGSGLDDEVRALRVYNGGDGDVLYVGGMFVATGGTTLNHIGMWDGRSWHALGTGMNGDVHSLAIFDDGAGPALYAGGTFTVAGGVSANRIARWDGTSWFALGEGITMGTQPTVYAIQSFDDGRGAALYVGGRFYRAGEVSVGHMAKWDGRDWHEFGGTGADNQVTSMALFDGGDRYGPSLFIGGPFTTIDGVPFSSVARFGGLGWSELGDGITTSSPPLEILAMTPWTTIDAPALAVGGMFGKAGEFASDKFALWRPVQGDSPADLNMDCTVSGLDLALLLGVWTGAVVYAPCTPLIDADLNADCKVNGLDLAILLSTWG